MKLHQLQCCILSVLSLVLCMNPNFAMSSEISPNAVRQMAEEEMDIFFGLIALEYVKKYGNPDSSTQSATFSNESVQDKGDTKVLKIGNPFEVWTMSSDYVLAFDGESNLSAHLIRTNQWVVPLTVHGKDHACMIVGLMKGEWQVVGVSLGNFGENIKEMPDTNRPGNRDVKFVRLNHPRTDFILTQTEDGEKMMLTPSSVKNFILNEKEKDPQGLYPLSSIIPKIADKIRSDVDAAY